MNELVKTIDELYAAFKTDAELQAGKNNKAAGLRARKVSLELEKKLKEFRENVACGSCQIARFHRMTQGVLSKDTFFVPAVSALPAEEMTAALSKIQPRSFPSVVREGFNRSRRLVLRFSTDILWTA